MLGSNASALIAREVTSAADETRKANAWHRNEKYGESYPTKIKSASKCGRISRRTKSTYHLACVPRLLRRFLMIGTRKVTAIVVLDRSFGSLTTAKWICLNGKRRSAFGLKPPIPASRSMARNATRIVGAQGTALARSHTVFATVITSSAVASIFSTVKSVQSPSSIAPAPKIHYT
jgi:hypothetical protein